MSAAPKKPAKKPAARRAGAGDLVTTRTGYARLKPKTATKPAKRAVKKTAGPGKKPTKRLKPVEEKKRGWF